MNSKPLKTIDIASLDLSDLTAVNQLAQDIHKECCETGFFFLRPTRDIQKLMDDMLKDAKMFFDLPLHKKLELTNDESTQIIIKGQSIAGTGAGYRGLGLDPNFSNDSRESFNIGSNCLGGESLQNIKDLKLSGIGANKWPDDTLLSGWQFRVWNFATKLVEVSVVLRTLLAVALGLPADFFDRKGLFDMSTWILGMVHYLPVQSDELSGKFGIRPHCDAGIFTLLMTDGSPGLEYSPNQSAPVEERIWIPIEKAPEGCFIVNLGQNLQFLTNNKVKATLHRVVNKSGKRRYSIPFFYESNIDLDLEQVLTDIKDLNLNLKAPADFLQNRLSLAKTDDFV